MKKILSHTLLIAFSLFVCIGFWAIGFGISTNKIPLNPLFKPFITAIVLLTILSLVFLSIINIVKLTKFRKSMKGLNATKRFELVTKLKEEIEKDYEKAEKAVNKSIERFTIYKVVVLVLIALFSFSMGLADNPEAVTPVILILTFTFYGVLSTFFKIQVDEKIPKDIILTPEEFPAIFEIINKASNQVGYKGKVQVVLGENGIAIAKRNNGVIITLQSEQLALLKEEEFLAILIHEFAHHFNKDIHRREIYSNFLDSHTNQAETTIDYLGKALFLNGYIENLTLKIISFEAISSRKKEEQADLFVTQNGLCQEFINGTAKACLFYLYSEYNWKEITFDTYKSEQPVYDYAAQNHKNFLQKVGLYGDKWHFTLHNELPARIDSHPTLKMRMASLNVEYYFVDFEIPNSSFKQDCERALNKTSYLMGEQFAKMGKDAYLHYRNSAYIERIEAMNRYNDFDSEWGSLSDSELIECAQAFLFIDDSKAEKILREVIERSSSSFACYLLGCLYSREYNDECIELFKKAAIDPSATDEAFDQLGKYALKTGNQKLLDEYRETVVNKNQVAEDENFATLFSKDGLTAPMEVHAPIINELTEKLCEYWKDSLHGLYIAFRETDNQTEVFYIAIDINKKLKAAELQKPYDESCFLINRMSQAGIKFYLFFNGKEYNEIKKIPNSCIYKK